LIDCGKTIDANCQANPAWRGDQIPQDMTKFDVNSNQKREERSVMTNDDRSSCALAVLAISSFAHARWLAVLAHW